MPHSEDKNAPDEVTDTADTNEKKSDATDLTDEELEQAAGGNPEQVSQESGVITSGTVIVKDPFGSS